MSLSFLTRVLIGVVNTSEGCHGASSVAGRATPVPESTVRMLSFLPSVADGQAGRPLAGALEPPTAQPSFAARPLMLRAQPTTLEIKC